MKLANIIQKGSLTASILSVLALGILQPAFAVTTSECKTIANIASSLYGHTKGKGMTQNDAKVLVVQEGRTNGSPENEILIMIGIVDIVYISNSSKDAYNKAYNQVCK